MDLEERTKRRPEAQHAASLKYGVALEAPAIRTTGARTEWTVTAP